MNSLWTETTTLPEFPSLSGDLKTNVLIIGGGIAGLLCAYELQKHGVDYALIEASKICSGITKNTTAKITAQHGLIYASLCKRFGKDAAALYLRANQQALEKYHSLAENIDCDFEQKDAFVYTLSDAIKIQEEAQALREIGYQPQLTQDLPLPLPVRAAICFPAQAQFHPLKFLAGISAPLRIYEHTKAQELSKHVVKTDRGEIRAKKIIIATHFPIDNKHGAYFIKMYQDRSYVIALEGAPDINGMYIDEAPQGLSFRNADHLLLLGGGSHRTGKQGGSWSVLEAFAAQHYPGANIRYSWATQDCMTLDALPYIGPYSPAMPNFYVATGFHKWGMTRAMIAAQVLTDDILGRENPFAPIFSPSRSVLRSQLFLNTAETLKNLLTPTRPRCPHLGCALKWNPVEHTWDCPCHGSRFDEDGNLIDNPSTADLKI